MTQKDYTNETEKTITVSRLADLLKRILLRQITPTQTKLIAEALRHVGIFN